MPYVNVPNDLSKIKTKMAFNLTKRQLVCFGSAGRGSGPTEPKTFMRSLPGRALERRM